MNMIYKMYSGFTKNTQSFETSYRTRIPDFINKVVVGEIKNVKYQYLSSQIKGFLEIAKNEGERFVLVVSETTTLSKALIKAIKANDGFYFKVPFKSSSPRVGPYFFVDKRGLDNFMKRFDPNSVY